MFASKRNEETDNRRNFRKKVRKVEEETKEEAERKRGEEIKRERSDSVMKSVSRRTILHIPTSFHEGNGGQELPGTKRNEEREEREVVRE